MTAAQLIDDTIAEWRYRMARSGKAQIYPLGHYLSSFLGLQVAAAPGSVPRL